MLTTTANDHGTLLRPSAESHRLRPAERVEWLVWQVSRRPKLALLRSQQRGTESALIGPISEPTVPRDARAD